MTVEPGSAVPVIGSVPLIGSTTGAAGGIASTTTTVGNELFPAGSVAIALTSSPSFKPGFGTVQVPSGPAITVVFVPSG